MNPTPENITEAIDIIFKMRRDGRMDKEEAGLLLNLIFSNQMDQDIFYLIRFVYRVRPHGDVWLLDDEKEIDWETILDFSDMPDGGIPIDELMEALRKERKDT